MSRYLETIDTNIILTLVLRSDQKLVERALRLLEDDSRAYLVPDQAITEAVFALEYKYGFTRTDIAEELSQIIHSISTLQYDDGLLTELMPFYVEHPKLSFNDCYLAYYAAKAQAEPLWTFDHKLAIQSATAKEVR